MKIPDLPFNILVLAPFHPVPEEYRPEIITASSADEAMKKLGPSLYFPLPADLCPEGGVSLQFESIKDFDPDTMVEKNHYLSRLKEARDYLISVKDNSSTAEIAEGLKQWPGLPIDVSKAGKEVHSQSSGGKVDDILSMVSSPATNSDTSAAPADWQNQLDQALRQCLYRVFSDPEFRKYEAAWRGADLLFRAGNQDVNVKLVSVSMSSLASCLDRLEEQLINDPPSLLVYDLALDGSTFAMEMLDKMADLSESLLAPCVAWFSERFLGLSDWEDLKRLSYLPNLLDQPEFAKWRKLMKRPAGEWITMLANRPLLRHAYDADHGSEKLGLREDRHLYLSPVWMLAFLMSSRFAETGWPTGLAGPGTSQLSGVPLRQEPDGSAYPVETMLSDDRSDQFLKIGVTPVSGVKDGDRVFVTRAVTASGRSLEYQLVLSRIISLVMWCKENFPTDWRADDVKDELFRIISGFFEKTGHAAPADLEVFASDDGSGVVSISLIPDQLVDEPQSIGISLQW